MFTLIVSTQIQLENIISKEFAARNKSLVLQAKSPEQVGYLIALVSQQKQIIKSTLDMVEMHAKQHFELLDEAHYHEFLEKEFVQIRRNEANLHSPYSLLRECTNRVKPTSF